MADNKNTNYIDILDCFKWNRFNTTMDDELSGYVEIFKCADLVAYKIRRFIIPSHRDFDNKNNRLFNMVQELLGKIGEHSDFQLLKNSFGIYFLFNEEDNISNGKKSLYVGRTDGQEGSAGKGMNRLVQHCNNPAESYFRKWDTAVYITKDNLIHTWDASTVIDLERYFINAFKFDKSYDVVIDKNKGQRGTNTPDDKLYGKYNLIIQIINGLLASTYINRPLKFYTEMVKELNSSKNTTFENSVTHKSQIIDYSKKVSIFSHEVSLDRRREFYNMVYDTTRSGDLYRFSDNRIFIRDKKSKQVCTDLEIAHEMVDSIPKQVFTSEAKFIDIACKSGVFIQALIEKLMSDDPELPINQNDKFDDRVERLDHILQHQLYAVCNVGEGWFISNKLLYDFIESEYNKYGRTSRNVNYIIPKIICIPGYEILVKYLGSDVSENKILLGMINENFGETLDMKFDVVIGNPPYNNDLYLDFVQFGHSISSKYTCMITPAKWQAKGGEKNDQFRDDIVPYMSKVVYYPCCQEIFGIRNLDGIAYYLIDKYIHESIVVENKSKVIRVIPKTDQRPDDLILLNSCVSIINKLKLYNKLHVDVESDVFGIGNPKIFELHSNPENSTDVLVPDASLGKGNGKMDAYIRKSLINKNFDLIDKYKVTMLGMGGNCYYDNSGMTLGMNKIYIRKPNEVTTNDYMCIYTCDKLDEALSFESYLNTRLVRFLLMASLVGQRIDMKETWRFVPDPGAFDHIFTDDELYKKYNLTQEEISIIESVIKERK